MPLKNPGVVMPDKLSLSLKCDPVRFLCADPETMCTGQYEKNSGPEKLSTAFIYSCVLPMLIYLAFVF